MLFQPSEPCVLCRGDIIQIGLREYAISLLLHILLVAKVSECVLNRTTDILLMGLYSLIVIYYFHFISHYQTGFCVCML